MGDTEEIKKLMKKFGWTKARAKAVVDATKQRYHEKKKETEKDE